MNALQVFFSLQKMLWNANGRNFDVVIGHCIAAFRSPVTRFYSSWLVVQWMNKSLRCNEWMRGPPVPNSVKVTCCCYGCTIQPPTPLVTHICKRTASQLFRPSCHRQRIDMPAPDERMKSAAKRDARNGTPVKDDLHIETRSSAK